MAIRGPDRRSFVVALVGHYANEAGTGQYSGTPHGQDLNIQAGPQNRNPGFDIAAGCFIFA
jgi:hypothetical protein